MNRFNTIIYFVFFFQCCLYSQNYVLIQTGNSLFIPKGSEFCSDYIIVEQNGIYSTEDTSGTCDNAVISGDGSISLPVELTSFTAELINEKNVLLKWQTETEINNFGFEIERSTSDNLLFTNIGFVKGNGNSNSPHSYRFIDNTIYTNNKNYYRIKQINTDGSFNISAPIEVNFSNQKIFSLSQNYPNPFNPSTIIKYSISQKTLVTLKVFDVLGRVVSSLINKVQPAGSYEITFNCNHLLSGIYFYKLTAGNFADTKKLIILK